MEGKGVGEETRDGITRGPVGYRGPVRGLCLTGCCLGPVNRMFVGGKLKELHRKTDSGRPRDPSFPVLASGSGETFRTRREALTLEWSEYKWAP